MRSGREFLALSLLRPPMPSPCWVRAHRPLGMSICAPTGKLQWAPVSSAFSRISLQRHDWLNHWPRDWTQSPVLLQNPWRSGWLKVLTYSNHVVSLPDDQPHLEANRGLPWATSLALQTTSITQEIQGFLKLMSETHTKIRQIPYCITLYIDNDSCRLLDLWTLRIECYPLFS